MGTLKILDRIIQYDSSEQGAGSIVSSIENIVSQSGLIIDSVDIDGIKIYSDHEKHIRENIESIESIQVNLITKDEFVTEILHTTYSYIKGALPKVQQIVDSFYTGEKDTANIDDLASLTEGIAWIYSVGKELTTMEFENSYMKAMLEMDYCQDIQRLEDGFIELKNAIMNMDYILIADILNYEILDVLNIISTSIEKLELSKEGISSKSKQN